jgi:hypothetical protein
MDWVHLVQVMLEGLVTGWQQVTGWQWLVLGCCSWGTGWALPAWDCRQLVMDWRQTVWGWLQVVLGC